MTVDAAIARFRQRQQAVFRSECTITRSSGEPVLDPFGELTQPTMTVYSGACNIRSVAQAAGEGQFGEQEVSVTRFVLKLPVDSAVQRDDTVLVTASTFDAGLVGRRFTVIEVQWDDWQIVRRATIEEAQ